MKRILCVFLVVMVLCSTAGCMPVFHNRNAAGKVVYHYEGVSFEDALTADEVAAVVEILNGKPTESPFLFGVPACGFDPGIAIIIDGTRYAVACDGCGTLRNDSTMGYIHISDQERQILEQIFLSRGGKFPCI